MKFSEPTKATLHGLSRLAGDLLLIPPDQFALIGKEGFFGKNNAKTKSRQHAGLSVRGTLLNTIKEAVGFSNFQSVADQLKPGVDRVCLSDNKIVSPAGSFRVSNEQELDGIKRALRAHRHAKPPELTDSFSWQLDRFEGDAFAFSMTDELYKQLLPSDYQVTIYSSGVAEWIAMDRRLTFLSRNNSPGPKLSSGGNEGIVNARRKFGSSDGQKLSDAMRPGTGCDGLTLQRSLAVSA